MAATGKKIDSLRLNRFENERLILALMISLSAHLLTWGGYEAGREFGWWQRLHWPVWLHHPAKINPQNAALLAQNSEPVVFIDVNPEQATAEAPKNAKYYSSKNSIAANPDASLDMDTPKLNGKQTDVPKTEDALRQNLNQLHPQSPASQPQEASPKVQPGDLTLGKPEDSQQQQQRPRTIREAMAQNHLPGLQMLQDGGVRRHLEISSMDAKATLFGAYDSALIDAVSQSWYHLLDQTRYAADSQGKVVIQFNLHSDGSVTDLRIAGDTADGVPGGIWAMVCQSAIENAAPFGRWPSDMLHEMGSNLRDVSFTFYYY
jgi:hypothetical protein